MGPVRPLGVAQPVGQDLVEDEPADGRLERPLDVLLLLGVPGRHAGHADGRVELEAAHPMMRQRRDGLARVDVAQLVGEQGLAIVLEGGRLALDGHGRVHGQVVAAQDHVLGGRHHGRAVRGREQVGGGEHHLARLVLGGLAEGHVDGHLVAVEVGVEGEADERMDLDGRALDELGHEGLDAQAVERRRPVEEHGMVLDDLLEDIPDLVVDTLHDALGALDVVGEALLHELAHDEGLEELEGHLLGQAALVQLEVGARRR